MVKNISLVQVQTALKEKRFSEALELSKKLSKSGKQREKLLYSRIRCSPACGRINYKAAIGALVELVQTSSKEALRILGFLLLESKARTARDFGHTLLCHAANLKDQVARDFLSLQKMNNRPLKKSWQKTLTSLWRTHPKIFFADPARGVCQKVKISETPKIRLVKNFLSENECDYLLALARKRMTPAVVYIEGGQTGVQAQTRSSKNFVLWPEYYDPVICRIDRRIAKETKTKIVNGEPLVVNRYGKGGEFTAHVDYFPADSPRIAFEGQRAWTIVIYLNQGYEGGRTAFFKAGIGIKGGKGDAIIFRNVTSNGTGDPDSVHAGLAVKKGTKWIITKGIRDKNFFSRQSEILVLKK